MIVSGPVSLPSPFDRTFIEGLRVGIIQGGSGRYQDVPRRATGGITHADFDA